MSPSKGPLRVFYSPRYFADLGDHVMPIRTFGLVREALEKTGIPVRIEAPEPVSDEDLLRVHTPEYLQAVATGAPRALAESQKFPWSPALAEAVRWTNGGCIAALSAALEPAIERARPDILLFQAGADPYREDPYSPLDLSHADLRARDELVFRTAAKKGIPVMWVLAGGYTKDVTQVVEVHLNTFLAAVGSNA
jgi:acetoin utilization deacetylase AcuC-like enzyme